MAQKRKDKNNAAAELRRAYEALNQQMNILVKDKETRKSGWEIVKEFKKYRDAYNELLKNPLRKPYPAKLSSARDNFEKAIDRSTLSDEQKAQFRVNVQQYLDKRYSLHYARNPINFKKDDPLRGIVDQAKEQYQAARKMIELASGMEGMDKASQLSLAMKQLESARGLLEEFLKQNKQLIETKKGSQRSKLVARHQFFKLTSEKMSRDILSIQNQLGLKPQPVPVADVAPAAEKTNNKKKMKSEPRKSKASKDSHSKASQREAERLAKQNAKAESRERQKQAAEKMKADKKQQMKENKKQKKSKAKVKKAEKKEKVKIEKKEKAERNKEKNQQAKKESFESKITRIEKRLAKAEQKKSAAVLEQSTKGSQFAEQANNTSNLTEKVSLLEKSVRAYNRSARNAKSAMNACQGRQKNADKGGRVAPKDNSQQYKDARNAAKQNATNVKLELKLAKELLRAEKAQLRAEAKEQAKSAKISAANSAIHGMAAERTLRDQFNHAKQMRQGAASTERVADNFLAQAKTEKSPDAKRALLEVAKAHLENAKETLGNAIVVQEEIARNAPPASKQANIFEVAELRKALGSVTEKLSSIASVNNRAMSAKQYRDHRAPPPVPTMSAAPSRPVKNPAASTEVGLDSQSEERKPTYRK